MLASLYFFWMLRGGTLVSLPFLTSYSSLILWLMAPFQVQSQQALAMALFWFKLFLCFLHYISLSDSFVCLSSYISRFCSTIWNNFPVSKPVTSSHIPLLLYVRMWAWLGGSVLSSPHSDDVLSNFFLKGQL